MIRLEKLSKYYKSENNITLGLSKINLELHNKEFVAIVGESGSGKSTLLNVISGIDSYEEGELYFNNEETSHYDLTDWENYRRNNISFVFQNYGLIDSYTVYQNVLAAMVINNQTEEESKQTALDIINQVGLSTHITHKATKLSGGQKQRLAIARALAKDSKVLVADEPTGNLDSTTGSEIIALLKEISKTKLVIMVTHDYEEVKDIVTRKIRVFDGNIVEDTIVNALDYKEEIIEEKENKQIDKSLFFTKRNILSQPKRTFFTFLVTFVMSLLIGLIISGFVYYTNLNTYTDVYNPYFENLNPNRVVVRKDDNSIMSDTDLDILNNYKYTADTFKYDTLLDVQGYLSTKDYYFPTCGFEDIDQLNDELHLGRLPNKVNEVVLSLPSSYIQKDMLDEDIITKVTFSNKQSELDVVIVGIVKSDDYSRVMYVSEELVSHVMLAYDFDLTISSNIVTQRMQSIVKPIDFIDKANTVYLSTYYENYFINCDIQLLDLIIKDANVIFTDNLEDHEVYFSTDIQEKLFITTQLSIYIDDVENLDKLQKDLKELGYETISPYYVSLDTQDILALINKIGMSVLCVVLVIVIYLLGFIVLKLIFSEKTKDFGILKSIGLDKKTILKTNILEITIYFLISTISSVILIEVLSLFLSFFDNFKFYHHSYLLIINLLLGLFISLRFNNYINKKSVMQTIKEK